MFGSRGTVEFRCHNSTFNGDKIINWVFITNAICKFAFKNRINIFKDKITDFNLYSIIKEVYSSELSDYLISYMSYRKFTMKHHYQYLNDGFGITEIEKDNLNEWIYPFKSLI